MPTYIVERFALWEFWLVFWYVVYVPFAVFHIIERATIARQYGIGKHAVLFAFSHELGLNRRLRRFKVATAVGVGIIEELLYSGILLIMFDALSLPSLPYIVAAALFVGLVHAWFGLSVYGQPGVSMAHRIKYALVVSVSFALRGCAAVYFQSLLLPIVWHVAWDIYVFSRHERDFRKQQSC